MDTAFAFSEQPTGMRRVSDFREATVIERKTGEIEPAGFATREEYELRAVLTIRFWANRAQHAEARRIAETTLIRRLLAPVLAEIAEVRKAVFDGDARATLEACDRMQKALGL